MKQTTNIETKYTNYHLIWKNKPTVYMWFKAEYLLKLAPGPILLSGELVF